MGHRPGQALGLHLTQERGFIFVLEMREIPAELQGIVWERPASQVFIECMMLKVSLETFVWSQYKAISYQQSASVM